MSLKKKRDDVHPKDDKKIKRLVRSVNVLIEMETDGIYPKPKMEKVMKEFETVLYEGAYEKELSRKREEEKRKRKSKERKDKLKRMFGRKK